MVNVAKAFAKEPPHESLTTCAAIARDFQWRYVDTKKTDQVVRYCEDAPRFAIAVRRAVEARDANGKHHNHQSKVDITARRKLGAKLVAKKKMVEKIASIRHHDRFDLLHDLIDEIKPFGIGPVTVYDVAVRVGAYLGIDPQSVYMHAGVRLGYEALFGAGSSKGIERVPLSRFPEPFCYMEADDIEDILCTYREIFSKWS